MPADPRRPDRVRRYQKTTAENSSTAEGVNAVGMICSLVGLLIKVGFIWNFVTGVICVHSVQLKWAAWIGVYCSLIYMANSKSSDDKKQLLSLFM